VIAAGITAVISAGNDGRDACLNSPGRAPGVINVGATDIANTVAFFSNRGRCVSLYAGGVGVLSLSNQGGNSLEPGTGTSFSAPLVAGAAAVIIQEAAESGKKLTPAEVKQALLQRADRGLVTARPALPTAENLFARVR
jgi:subtilisin family serine protease